MKLKPTALVLSLTMLLAALAGCTTHNAKVATTTSPRAGVIGVLDREAERIRGYMSRNKGNAAATRAENQALRDDVTDLSARHLTALIGLSHRDVHSTLGEAQTRGLLINGHNYNQTVYGADTDLYVQYDDNNHVNKVVVTLDEDDALRWRRELNALYGIQIHDDAASSSQWLDKNTQINWTRAGDAVRITITGKSL